MEEKKPDFDFCVNFLLCFYAAIVGGVFGVILAFLFGKDDIAGIFFAVGFFLTIIIYVIFKPWWDALGEDS